MQVQLLLHQPQCATVLLKILCEELAASLNAIHGETQEPDEPSIAQHNGLCTLGFRVRPHTKANHSTACSAGARRLLWQRDILNLQREHLTGPEPQLLLEQESNGQLGVPQGTDVAGNKMSRCSAQRHGALGLVLNRPACKAGTCQLQLVLQNGAARTRVQRATPRSLLSRCPCQL